MLEKEALDLKMSTLDVGGLPPHRDHGAEQQGSGSWREAEQSVSVDVPTLFRLPRVPLLPLSSSSRVVKRLPSTLPAGEEKTGRAQEDREAVSVSALRKITFQASRVMKVDGDRYRPLKTLCYVQQVRIVDTTT